MRGVITGKDLLFQAATIIRLFGVAIYVRCLWAAVNGRRSTFLGVLYPCPLGGDRRLGP
jgi:hypothetical protein